MPVFHITLPDGASHAVDVPSGRTLLDACREANLPLIGLCGGEMACATCHVHVDPAWRDRLSPAGETEEDMLDLLPDATEHSRLACRIEASPALDGLPVSLVAVDRGPDAAGDGAGPP